MKQTTAKLNHLHIAPRKVRLIADGIRGLRVNEAEAQLMFRPQRSSGPLLKLLRSAVANAKNNEKLDADKLVVKSIFVDQGPVMKRFLPRSMGRATPLLKRTSHVTIILEEGAVAAVPRFNINVSKKIKKSKEKSKPAKLKTEKKEEMKKEVQKPKEKVGFFKKIFRRKSV
ncbi:MAG: 50S ribosomal protein L22 [Patescibacteria group bacterium]